MGDNQVALKKKRDIFVRGSLIETFKNIGLTQDTPQEKLLRQMLGIPPSKWLPERVGEINE